MRKITAVIVSILAVAAILWLGAGWRQNSIRDSAFEQTVIGDTEAQVLGRFGPPDYVEPIGDPYLRYTGAPCEAPCQSRLWWEDAILPGIGAWSVELGADHRVVHTARWVSP
jgi:hypothetical protein